MPTVPLTTRGAPGRNTVANSASRQGPIRGAQPTLQRGELSLKTVVILAFGTGNAEAVMGRGILLWLLGIPLPIILLIWVFGGLHG